MSDPVHDLYQANAYPAMSHPSCDPATTYVAARLSGLKASDPSRSRILEIGCATGHNLLSLAARWPESRFTGIDFSGTAIQTARETATAAGLSNIELIEANLTDFDAADGPYDYVIAHGVYSWVPPPVREALVRSIPRLLSPCGVATISYNTLPGWSLRHTVVQLVGQLRGSVPALAGKSPVEILSYLESIEGDGTHHMVTLREVIHDMLRKSGDILLYDDFAPTNQPVLFLDFVSHVQASGMTYLGESQLSANFPLSFPPDSMAALKVLAESPLALQQTLDVLTNRTFRNSLVCRADAHIDTKLDPTMAMEFSVRILHKFERTSEGGRLVDIHGEEQGRFTHPLAIGLFSTLADSAPETIPMQEVYKRMAEMPAAEPDPQKALAALARLLLDAARRKLVELRSEPTLFNSRIPSHPKLSLLRRKALEKKESLVDIYHAPCSFPPPFLPVLNAMDGDRNIEELAALAHVTLPRLDFRAWLAHLAARGMFVG